MSTLFLAVLAVVAVPGDEGVRATNSPDPQPAAVERGFHGISKDIFNALRDEATAKTPKARLAAVHRMAELYGEISTDSRLESSDFLKQQRAQLWSRMTHVKDRALKQSARRRRSGRPASQEDQLASASALAGSMALVGRSMGGPAALVAGTRAAGAGGGGAVPPDHGEKLVELIQNTIAPEAWDVNGGPASIVYFAPLRVLVVRATSEAHHNVGGLVGDLRAAGQ